MDHSREFSAKAGTAALVVSAILCGLPATAATGIQCRLTAQSVPAYGRIEIRFGDSWKVENPDDPRQADVTGIFTSPSGREWRMPGFLYRDFERDGDRIVPRGQPEWRVRFTPEEPGRWKASLRATVGGETYAANAGNFEVTKAAARGFLRRSKANPLAFEFENGAPLIAIGSNIFPQTAIGRPVGSRRAADVIRYLEHEAAAGATFCRLRVDSWFIPIELTSDKISGYEGPGRYHPQSCWEVDQIVAAAERLGITLQFCISNANANVNLDPDRNHGKASRQAYNFYLKAHGGPLDSNGQFWSNPEIKRLFLQKMRYCLARWGASPAVGIWEFFNEVRVTPETADAIAAWHSTMAPQWRAMDPYKRPIATSPVGGYNGTDSWWKLFSPELDVIEYHTYAFEDLAMGIAGWNLDILRKASKPLLVGEFGSAIKLREELGSKGSDPRLDPAGLHLHNGIWAAAMTGAAGALPWFITNYIDTLDLYHVFTGFSRFAADWKINAGPWRPIRAGVQADFDKIGRDKWGPLELPTAEALSRAPSDVYRVNHDGSVTGGSYVSGFLFGLQAHKDLRCPPTFEVDYPRDGTFAVTVKYVVGKHGSKAPVIVELDGREVARKIFLSGEGHGKQATHISQYDNWKNLYDEEISVPVPAGKHRIRVDAQPTDRVAVGYRLDPYGDRSMSAYRVYAMGLGGEVRLWVQNSTNTAANHLHKHPPVDKPPATLRVAVSEPGRYEAEWWDTVKGVPTRRAAVESKDGFVSLDFAGTLSDEACKIHRGPSQGR